MRENVLQVLRPGFERELGHAASAQQSLYLFRIQHSELGAVVDGSISGTFHVV